MKFRRVKPNDIWDILEISNDFIVRKFSINRRNITREEHKKWFGNIDKTLFFVIEVENKVVGQVRFSRKGGNIFEVSISIHPKYRSKGLGKLILLKGLKQLFLRYPKARILARVFINNQASINLFKKFNFRSIGFDKGMYIFLYRRN